MKLKYNSAFNFLGLIDGINKNRSDKVNVQLRTFYDSCMDVDTIRTKGFIPGTLLSSLYLYLNFKTEFQ